MNYGQVKNQVLKLLDQYSVAGNEVEPSYNNQQDYLNRIPGLVNDAVMEIATTVRKIPTVMGLCELPYEDLGEAYRYQLPRDFYQLISGGVVKTRGGTVLHTNLYQTQGRSFLIVPKAEAGDCSIEYYRYPMLLADRPKDTDELDNAPETHFAVPYYAAAFLASRDDPYLCALLNNKYDDKLAAMGAGLNAEVSQVSDVYGFGGVTG